MTPEQILDFIAENSPDSLTADSLDAALIGWTEGMRCLAVYDTDKCIEIFMARDGMTHDEAVEFFDFNVAGAYLGENTPIFVTIPQVEQ